MSTPDPTAVQANAFAIAYRLLGDRPAAQAAVGIAVERTRSAGDLERPDWLSRLAESVVTASVGAASGAVRGDAGRETDQDGLRDALRRRLASATADQRVAASLHHLAGYPIDAVAGFMGRPVDEVAALAATIAPPPGVDYRSLGDPRLIGPTAAPARHRRFPVTTAVTAVVLLAIVVGASRCVGPRPTLGAAPQAIPVKVGPTIAPATSEGCTGTEQPSGVFAATVEVGTGSAASYRLAVPRPGIPAPGATATTDGSATTTAAQGQPAAGTTALTRPLVLAVSDVDSGVDAFLEQSEIESRGLEDGYIVATFAPAPDRAGTTASVEDTGAVLTEILRRSCIDTNRVTVTGLGTGAQTASALACARPSAVTSAAAVGGVSMPPNCTLSPAVSLLMLWNADDLVFPPSGGTTARTGSPDDAGGVGLPAAPLPADAAGRVALDWSRSIGAGEPQRSTGGDSSVTETATAPSGAQVLAVTAASGGHTWTPETTNDVLAFATEHARAS